MKSIQAMQNSFNDRGKLKISTVSKSTSFPIKDVRITISSTGNPDTIIDTLTTNAIGQTDAIELPAPPVDLSLNEDNVIQPYSEYNLLIEADEYEPVTITGSEILSGLVSLQNVALTPSTIPNASPSTFVIGPHTLYGNYPPKIPEAEIKPIQETGEIVLNRVVVPEIIVVHDGAPTDSTATNYFIKYKDYIKNVASSEIYATWPTDTLRANILAIMSFTLNRVYTEWYRNKGYNFTITSSPAFDQKWIPERNIYDTISAVVDELFTDYLSRPNVKQPIFAQYCDGKKVSCPNRLSQWGSKDLGDQGFTPIEILRYYYGEDVYINTATEVSGVPTSWPGVLIATGSTGEFVRVIQEQINAIANAYPLIPKVAVDGIYGPATKNSVKVFQSVFNLPETGDVGYSTWYKLSEIFVAVSRIASLN